MGFRCTHYRDPEGCELLALVMEWCELEGGSACMRMCVNGVQILKMSALSEKRTFTSLFQWPNLVHHYTPKHMSSNKLAVSAVC